MGTSKKTVDKDKLEERGVKALESIATSVGEVSDWLFELDSDLWQERLEWYLNEFYQIAKQKTVGTSVRPSRESERIQETTETQGEESKS